MVVSVDERADIVSHAAIHSRVPRCHRWPRYTVRIGGGCGNVFAADERTGESGPELVELVGAVAEAMIIGDIMKELLSVKSSTEEERKATVCGFDDVCNFIDGLTTIERIFVRETVFYTFGGIHASLERLSDTT